jgi:hypothetical protein
VNGQGQARARSEHQDAGLAAPAWLEMPDGLAEELLKGTS